MGKIAILGNCQMFSISNYLNSNEFFLKDWEILDIPPVFQISDGHKVLDIIKGVDCLITQPFYSPIGGCDMSLDILRSYCSNCIVFPSLYFDGYNPELFYLKINGALEKSPIFEYTLANILFSYIENHSIERCVEIWYPQSSEFQLSDYKKKLAEDISLSSIAELERREIFCDIKSVSFIKEGFLDSRVFYTMNHPSVKVMNHIVSQIFERICGNGYIQQSSDFFSHTYMPIIYPLKGYFGFDDGDLFKINGSYHKPSYVVSEFYKWFSCFSKEDLKKGLDLQVKLNPLIEGLWE